MPDSLASMQMALRVLAAILEKRHPDAGDVEGLRRLAPNNGDLPLDDLACLVIQQAVRDRENRRPPRAKP